MVAVTCRRRLASTSSRALCRIPYQLEPVRQFLWASWAHERYHTVSASHQG